MFSRLKFFKIILLLLLCNLLLLPVADSFTLISRVREFELKNGFKVLVLERHNSPTVSFSMRFKTGSVDEISGSSGVAHLLEHMLFKGTKTIGTKNFKKESAILKQIDRTAQSIDLEMKNPEGSASERTLKLRNELKKLQGEHIKLIVKDEMDSIYSRNGAVGLNASTGFDITTYKVSLPSNRLELWARIESERFFSPVFRQFYSERDVVLEERRQSYETKPQRILMTNFLSAAFRAHPYGRPIIGWKSDIRYMSKEVLENFFRSRYSLSNAVLSIVGDVNFDETKLLIEKYFEDIETHSVPQTNISDEPEQIGQRRIQVHFDAEPRILIGYHKPTLPHYADYVFDLIDGLLSGGRTSRLYKALVLDKKVATSVGTSNGFPGARYPNLFMINVLPSAGHSSHEAETAVYYEIENLKNGQISDAELLKVKNQFKVDLIRKLQSNAELAALLSYYEVVCNDWKYIEKYLETIDGITPDDIQKAAAKYLIPTNRTVAYIVKDEGDET